MNYHIKKNKDLWVVYYTTGRTSNEWVFKNRAAAKQYLEQCKGETA